MTDLVPDSAYLCEQPEGDEVLVTNSVGELLTTEGRRVGYEPKTLVLLYQPGDKINVNPEHGVMILRKIDG